MHHIFNGSAHNYLHQQLIQQYDPAKNYMKHIAKSQLEGSYSNIVLIFLKFQYLQSN
jgi:hypothetical protein